MSFIHEHNRKAWDHRAVEGDRFARAATPKDFSTSNIVKHGGSVWLEGSIAGRRILLLASGGGMQSAMYAKAGAVVTVVDISPKMLELDRKVAAEYKLDITPVEASMDDLSMLEEAHFDAVVQPVSTCYVPSVAKVYENVARVIKDRGIYISQHKQPASLQADVQPTERGYELIVPYYNKDPLPPVAGSLHREAGTIEFLHSWQQLIGGLCRTGFVVEDLTEPNHAKIDALPGSFEDRSKYLPPYVLIKARRRPRSEPAVSGNGKLWTPK